MSEGKIYFDFLREIRGEQYEGRWDFRKKSVEVRKVSDDKEEWTSLSGMSAYLGSAISKFSSWKGPS